MVLKLNYVSKELLSVPGGRLSFKMGSQLVPRLFEIGGAATVIGARQVPASPVAASANLPDMPGSLSAQSGTASMPAITFLMGTPRLMRATTKKRSIKSKSALGKGVSETCCDVVVRELSNLWANIYLIGLPKPSRSSKKGSPCGSAKLFSFNLFHYLLGFVYWEIFKAKQRSNAPLCFKNSSMQEDV
jgi:hypothetical protein